MFIFQRASVILLAALFWPFVAETEAAGTVRERSLQVMAACSFFGKAEDATVATENASDEVEALIERIVTVSGLRKNFEVRAAPVANAAAVISDGRRYILYNPRFAVELRRMNGRIWSFMSVLAHEVGHHLNGHTLANDGSRPPIELEADYFSGFVLQKMGAPLTDAQLVMTRLWNAEITRSSHVLRLDTLTALGGAQAIVHTHLDTVMGQFKPVQREVAARVFEHLVTPSGNKIAHTVSDLAAYAEVPAGEVRVMVHRLAQPDLRILRPVIPGLSEQGQIRYEIFHDALAPAILDWRTRHFRRGTILERFTLPVILLVVAVLMQIYRWFFRYTGRTVPTLSVIDLVGSNLGLLLGVILSILWYVSTTWPPYASLANPLGTLSPVDFVKYLLVVMPTLLVSVITFLVMQSAGRLSHHLLRHFDWGFYGAYLVACATILVWIALIMLGLMKPWILF